MCLSYNNKKNKNNIAKQTQQTKKLFEIKTFFLKTPRPVVTSGSQVRNSEDQSCLVVVRGVSSSSKTVRGMTIKTLKGQRADFVLDRLMS